MPRIVLLPRLPWALIVFLPSVLALAGCAITGCAPVVDISWSPDSQRIAWAAGDELRLYDVETKQIARLSTGADSTLAPAWSPDGKAIAFYSVVQGDEAAVSLCVMDPTSGQITTLAPGLWPIPRELSEQEVPAAKSSAEALVEAQQSSLAGLVVTATAAWSPDGKRLACGAATRAGGQVLLLDYPDGAPKAVVEDKQAIFTLAWSPDGRRLAYVLAGEPLIHPPAASGEASEPEEPEPMGSLWVYDLDAASATRICDLPEDAYVLGSRIAWSADSKEIGLISSDLHYQDRAIGCTIEAQPGAAMRQEMRGLTTAATWRQGLKGVAFLEKREGGEVVLLYRGRQPRTRKVLGALPKPPAREVEADEETSDPYSLPQFSPDGRKVALRVGDDPESAQIAVFPVP